MHERALRKRRRVTIHGVVQGVYFRETVRRIAERHDVAGFVRNAGYDRVEIEAEGRPEVVDAFVDEVLGNPPSSARINHVQHAETPAAGETGFRVTPSVRP